MDKKLDKNFEIECIIKGIKYDPNIGPVINNQSSYSSVNGQTHTTLDTIDFDNGFEELKLCTFPRLRKPDKIYLPKKIERLFDYYISKKDLREIDDDLEVAKELCYFVISLMDMFKPKYHNISQNYLSELIFGDSYIIDKKKIKSIFNLLLKGSEKKGPIIECDNIKKIGSKSFGYKLTETYLNKGHIKYKLKTDFVKKVNYTYRDQKFKTAIKNPIARNLITLSSIIEFPEEKKIIQRGKILEKSGYKTKKGKILKFRNKVSMELDDHEKYSYVEDNIKDFKFLTEEGFIIPIVSGKKSGGRVYDSFNLMPSWIRSMSKIDGQEIVELDYSCLHPNILVKLYGGTTKYITHENVANELKMSKEDVKRSHLTFFNLEIEDMYKSPLMKYYLKTEPNMIKRIINDKYKHDYKITSQKCFKLEVEIMTEVIKRLNDNGILAGYIFDALFINPSDKMETLRIMNETIKEFGVFTSAK